MRILFDQGVYDLRNMGNVALLQVEVERILRRWPEARLEVMTSAPHLLRLYCPTAIPVSPDGAFDWSRRRGALDSLLSKLPLPCLRAVLELREVLRNRRPGAGLTLTRTAPPSGLVRGNGSETAGGGTTTPMRNREVDSALLDGVDVLVATGAQYMSDAVQDNAHRVLDRMEMAHGRNIATAMVGQGIGPFENSELRRHVHCVLPTIDRILIRDGVAGAKLLDSLGVEKERVVFTGDDAIGMAYACRPRELGKRLGVGMRIAHYTGVSASHLEPVRHALAAAAARHGCRPLTLPVSYSSHELDDRVLGRLTGRPTWKAIFARSLGTPRELVKRVGKCRIVVTGTFHPAVFALSQGIPVVGLAQSPMYEEKFQSLSDQFGPGCRIVRLGDEKAGEALRDAIDTAWQSAARLRPGLLEAAADLVETGLAGYRSLFERVESNQRVEAC